MKADTILMLAGIGAIGVIGYMLINPLTKGVQGVQDAFAGFGQGVQGVGAAVSGAVQGVGEDVAGFVEASPVGKFADAFVPQRFQENIINTQAEQATQIKEDFFQGKTTLAEAVAQAKLFKAQPSAVEKAFSSVPIFGGFANLVNSITGANTLFKQIEASKIQMQLIQGQSIKESFFSGETTLAQAVDQAKVMKAGGVPTTTTPFVSPSSSAPVQTKSILTTYAPSYSNAKPTTTITKTATGTTTRVEAAKTASGATIITRFVQPTKK